MVNNKNKKIFFVPNKIGDWLKIATIIGSIIFTVTFFIYEMQGIPPRVSKLEQDLPATREQLRSEIDKLKSEIDRNGAKTDIILDDVKIIKSMLIKEGHK